MSKNKGIRRSNNLNPLEVDIATTAEDVDTITFEDATSRFMADGERRGLREATIKYYRNELGQFRRWLVKQDRRTRIALSYFVYEALLSENASAWLNVPTRKKFL